VASSVVTPGIAVVEAPDFWDASQVPCEEAYGFARRYRRPCRSITSSAVAKVWHR